MPVSFINDAYMITNAPLILNEPSGSIFAGSSKNTVCNAAAFIAYDNQCCMKSRKLRNGQWHHHFAHSLKHVSRRKIKPWIKLRPLENKLQWKKRKIAAVQPSSLLRNLMSL